MTLPSDPDSELAALHARRRRARVRRVVIVIVLGLAAVGGWFATRPAPERPERTLFARTLPAWNVERLNHRDGASERARLLDEAAPWPEVRAALEAMTDAYGGETRPFLEKVKQLDAAIERAGLPYWIDAPRTGDKQWVTSYDILGSSTWTLATGASTRVLRVRRLDRMNLEMAFLGHAGGSDPVVLQDRIEAELLELMQDAYDTVPRAGAVESASRGAWRTAMQGVADPAALAEAWTLLQAREQRLKEMLVGNGRRVELEAPERIEWGDAWFETLEPYADLKRPGGPMILPATLKHLRDADRALRSGPERAALDQVLAVLALSTEAHEARHALEPIGEGPVPQLILDEAGDDDLRFARSAANEAIAYLGQLHASDRPCQVLSVLVQRAADDRARTTPHHYASRTILRALSGTTEARLGGNVLEELLLDTCRLPADEVHRKASDAHKAIFGTPLVEARRSVTPG